MHMHMSTYMCMHMYMNIYMNMYMYMYMYMYMIIYMYRPIPSATRTPASARLRAVPVAALTTQEGFGRDPEQDTSA